MANISISLSDARTLVRLISAVSATPLSNSTRIRNQIRILNKINNKLLSKIKQYDSR